MKELMSPGTTSPSPTLEAKSLSLGREGLATDPRDRERKLSSSKKVILGPCNCPGSSSFQNLERTQRPDATRESPVHVNVHLVD